MPPTLRLHLINEFRLFVDAEAVDGLHQPRLQALLAYLALYAQTPQPRQQIAVRFWLDSSEQQARTNLRKLLHRLQQLLPQSEQWLLLGQHELGWGNGVVVTSDVADLEHALAELESLQPDQQLDPAQIETVMRIYTGDLLPGCYDEWLLARRDALAERVLHALHDALDLLATQQAYQVGIRCAEFLLRLDPLREEVYRQLMRLHALAGDRAAALQVYRTCVEHLREELDVPPSAETEALAARLQREDLRAVRTATPVAPASQEPPIPLVGRQTEWQTLLAAWQQTPQRGPHLILIWGEAGLGKTRLIDELVQWASLRPGTCAVARAYAAEGNLPYAPVITWLRSAAIRPKVSDLAAAWRTEIARLLPELQQEDPTLPSPQPMSESWHQQRFREALTRVFPTLPGPCLLVLDDSQWCDVETLHWLRYLLRFAPQMPLLVAVTARSDAVTAEHPLHELVHELQRSQQVTQVELRPLQPDATTALMQHLAGEGSIPDAAHLAAETEGNPLFVVEMVRARLADAQVEGGDTPALPATVQAVIASRLAQLSPAAHQVAELAAAIDRAFTAGLLNATGLYGEEQLVAGLDELWQRRILSEAAGTYEFSHDKIREVAYAAIAPMQRRRLHRQIAQALEAVHAADLAPVWGQLAHHYQQAQRPLLALPYLVRMAERADALDAYGDAAAYYARAIALHDAHAADDAAGAFDLRYQRTALLERHGDTTVLADDVAMLQELARRLDDPSRQAMAALSQAAYRSSKGDVVGAVQAGEDALARYRTAADEAGEIHALRELGLICWSAQDYGSALRYGRQALQLHRRRGDGMGEATALHNLAEIYRSLHSPQQAMTLYAQALDLYWGQQDPRGQAITLYGLAATLRQVAQPDRALDAYRRAQALCEEAGDRLIRSRVYHAMGILHWELEQRDAALAAMRQAVALSEGMGYLPGVAYSLVAQGYMAARNGTPEEAVALLERALTNLVRMDDTSGVREVQMRLDLLQRGELDLPEPPASLHWLRGHVILTDWKVYCEFELPSAATHID